MRWSGTHERTVVPRKKGVPITPEHRANIKAAMLRPEVRARLSELRRQESRTPGRLAQLAALHAAQRGRKMRRESVAKWQASIEKRYLHNGSFHSTLEERAAAWLLPRGYKRFVWIGQNSFDFGLADKSLVIEIQGCYWHDHRTIKPSCRHDPKPGVGWRDVQKRAFCRERGVTLIELWECEESDWPDILNRLLAAVDAA